MPVRAFECMLANLGGNTGSALCLAQPQPLDTFALVYNNNNNNKTGRNYSFLNDGTTLNPFSTDDMPGKQTFTRAHSPSYPTNILAYPYQPSTQTKRSFILDHNNNDITNSNNSELTKSAIASSKPEVALLNTSLPLTGYELRRRRALKSTSLNSLLTLNTLSTARQQPNTTQSVPQSPTTPVDGLVTQMEIFNETFENSRAAHMNGEGEEELMAIRIGNSLKHDNTEACLSTDQLDRSQHNNEPSKANGNAKIIEARTKFDTKSPTVVHSNSNYTENKKNDIIVNHNDSANVQINDVALLQSNSLTQSEIVEGEVNSYKEAGLIDQIIKDDVNDEIALKFQASEIINGPHTNFVPIIDSNNNNNNNNIDGENISGINNGPTTQSPLFSDDQQFRTLTKLNTIANNPGSSICGSKLARHSKKTLTSSTLSGTNCQPSANKISRKEIQSCNPLHGTNSTKRTNATPLYVYDYFSKRNAVSYSNGHIPTNPYYSSLVEPYSRETIHNNARDINNNNNNNNGSTKATINMLAARLDYYDTVHDTLELLVDFEQPGRYNPSPFLNISSTKYFDNNLTHPTSVLSAQPAQNHRYIYLYKSRKTAKRHRSIDDIDNSPYDCPMTDIDRYTHSPPYTMTDVEYTARLSAQQSDNEQRLGDLNYGDETNQRVNHKSNAKTDGEQTINQDFDTLKREINSGGGDASNDLRLIGHMKDILAADALLLTPPDSPDLNSPVLGAEAKPRQQSINIRVEKKIEDVGIQVPTSDDPTNLPIETFSDKPVTPSTPPLLPPSSSSNEQGQSVITNGPTHVVEVSANTTSTFTKSAPLLGPLTANDSSLPGVNDSTLLAALPPSKGRMARRGSLKKPTTTTTAVVTTTTTKKKRVIFADEAGQNLISVKMMTEFDLPDLCDLTSGTTAHYKLNNGIPESNAVAYDAWTAYESNNQNKKVNGPIDLTTSATTCAPYNYNQQQCFQYDPQTNTLMSIVNPAELVNSLASAAGSSRSSKTSSNTPNTQSVTPHPTYVSQNVREYMALWLPEFVLPIAEYGKFLWKLEKELLSLETIDISPLSHKTWLNMQSNNLTYASATPFANTRSQGFDQGGFCLTGTVKVKNITFEKSVFVRVTFDQWKHWRDYPCTYVPLSSFSPPNQHVSNYAHPQQRNINNFHHLTKKFDNFEFEIQLPSAKDVLQSKAVSSSNDSDTPTGSQDQSNFNNTNNLLNQPSLMSLEFAVCLKCMGNEYWDNNAGSNYRVSLKSSTERQYTSNQQVSGGGRPAIRNTPSFSTAPSASRSSNLYGPPAHNSTRIARTSKSEDSPYY